MEEPVIKTLPPHHQRVTPIVAWTTVWAVTMLGIIPSMMQAQELPQQVPNVPMFDQMGPPGGTQQPPTGFGDHMMGDQQRGDGQQGPSDEQMQKMQQQGLDRMKKGLTSFSKQLAKIKARIAALEKKGIQTPQDLKDALAKADDLVSKVNSAQPTDDVQDVPGDLQDVVQTIQDQLPNMERLANLSKIYARIDKQLKTFDKQLASDQALAAKSKIDVSAAVANFQDELNKLKQAYADAKAKIDSGDVEGGFSDLQDNVFDAIGNVGQAHAAVQQIIRLSTTIRSIDREIAADQKKLDALKKAGKDTAEAQGILDEGKAKEADLKSAAAAQPIDTSAISDILDQLADIRDRFASALEDLTGVSAPSPLDQGLSVPSLNMPSGFGQ